MTPLEALIRTEIEASGPMAVERYIQLCLSHPTHGYYTKADPLGAAGDFTTAPEVSQLFGELIGVWLLAAWRALGAPSACALVELGPGRGTLMADIVRTTQLDPTFGAAVTVHLVETSPVLRAKQSETLAALGITPQHHHALETLPETPTLWVANEFFDALPVNQWVRTAKGWNARRIGLSPEGQLVFGLDPTPLPAPKPVAAQPEGAMIEHSPAQDAVMQAIAHHALKNGGAGLIIDYGALTPGTGDTLQAVRKHDKVDPLDAPGTADLTTHVDFAHLAGLAHPRGLTNLAMAEQGAFLLALGLLERAGQLGASANEATREAISLAVERLAGDAAMGQLFKVLGFASAPIPLPGLAPWTPEPRKEPA